MRMESIVLQCIYAMIGTLGFCMIFHVEKDHLLAPSIGGAICWVMYLLLIHFGFGIFLSTFIAAAFVGIYGELLSSLEKVPGTMYFMPCCVPLIPGSNLYYAMKALIAKDWILCQFHLAKLALFATGISLGLGIVVEMKHIRNELHFTSGDARFKRF